MPDSLNNHHQPTILIVDDGMTIRMLVRETLERAGFNVIEAADGRQAVHLFEQFSPDLVLLDVIMPELDGFETCAALRAMPTGEHLPIVMLTGLEDEGSIHHAYEVGATDFITKPINFALLGHRIRYLLRASHAFVELRQNEDALRQEVTTSTTLAYIGRDLTSSLATPVILERLCQLTATALGCDSSHALVWNADQNAYTLGAGWGYTPTQLERLRHFSAPAHILKPFLHTLTQEEVISQDPDHAQSQIPPILLTHLGFQSALCFILRRGNEVIGVQTVGSRVSAPRFTPQQHRLALGVAQFAALALENAHLLEQAESANRLKSDFLATVSHELRTPLQVILGYNDLLLEQTFGPLTSTQVETLQKLGRSAQGLLELINATLQVGRLEAGQLPVDAKEVDVRLLMAEIQGEMMEFFHQSGLQFEYHASPDLPRVTTDPYKLKVVIKNLVGNAIKFTEKGKISVDLKPKDDGLEIAVTDSGSGISPKDLTIIFEAFRQGEQKVLTRQHGGVGLGLYIVKRMLELLGGSVAVDSVPGKGSTFRIWLPRQQALSALPHISAAA